MLCIYNNDTAMEPVQCGQLTMKEPSAQKRESGSSEEISRENSKERQAFAASAEARPLAELSHRAAVMPPLLADTLARFEGIARWGLNE
jgi:hypothetical protein